MSNRNAKEKVLLKEKIEETLIITEQKIAELEELTQPIGPEKAIGRVSRMDSDDFGTCNLCKRPIPPARLMYMPENTPCVACAER